MNMKKSDHQNDHRNIELNINSIKSVKRFKFGLTEFLMAIIIAALSLIFINCQKNSEGELC